MGEFDSTPMFESILDEYIIEKAGTFYIDEAKYDKNIKSTWFIKSDNGVDNCCVSVAGYNKPLRGRSMAIVLKKDGDKWVTMIKRKANGDREFPGGGWDKGETTKDAAIRELHEEAQVNIKNVKRIGTSIQFSDKESDVSKWVKDHVKKEDWWYGYYSAVFIGLYDGKFTGKISEEDIEHTFSWQPISKIKSKINKDLYDAVVKFTEENKEYKESTDVIDEFDEAVSVEGKKFTKAYRASIDYKTGHLLKVTYSLEGCEVTNVGYSKAVREVAGEVAEDYVRANHRGNKNTKKIRAWLAVLKGIVNGPKRLEQRKKFITNFLNKHIGDVGFLDFQAKDCKIIDIYDMYEKKHITDEVETVGIFAARFTPTATKMIISKEDMNTVYKRVKAPGSRFKVSKIKVGDIEKQPLFMSTYWNDKDDHQLIDIDGQPIKDDVGDRKLEGNLDSIQAIIGDLEVKGYHIDDKYIEDFLNRYRSRDLGNEEMDPFKESTFDFMYEEVVEMMYTEEVGDADDNKPKSDHPVKDIFMDIDRATVKHQQNAKRTVQNIQNAGRAAMKPINRAKDWIGNMIANWKDADENNIKEKMADPHARKNLFSAIHKAITAGALLRAGILFNPLFLFLAVTKGIGKNKKEFRLRNEMIGEIKTELEIVDEKIAYARSKDDMKGVAELMRFKNELKKKLVRVGGSPSWAKIV